MPHPYLGYCSWSQVMPPKKKGRGAPRGNDNAKKSKEPGLPLELNEEPMPDESVLGSNDEPQVRVRPRAPAQVYCVCVRIRPGSTTYC